MIPVINARSLFADPGLEQNGVDRLIADDAKSMGYFSLSRPPELVPTAPSDRQQLLRGFSLSEDEQHKMW